MKKLRDSVWQRQGTSWIWDSEALSQVCEGSEVWSLRQFLQAKGRWPNEVPSNKGRSLVVAGLDSVLDLLSPSEADKWLSEEFKLSILSFQDHWGSDAALIFWLPSGTNRIATKPATDTVIWKCAAPNSGKQLDFGRLLWGEAREYPQEILLREGGNPAGLYHLRIT